MIHKESTARWAEIGGQKCYFRSLWERNFSRYLQFLKETGQIRNWSHEPKTFWFEGIKRGVVSYKPDFQVIDNDGRTVWYEVKGFMDSKSKTKIRRFAKYFPEETLRIIGPKWFADNNQKLRMLIPDWEIGKSTLPKRKPMAKVNKKD